MSYGYENDEVRQSVSSFGLNPGAAKMVKFEWINNAGKDGAEMEALDIQFALTGGDRPTSFRLFPVTKAFGKDNVEITDPKAPEFQKALKDFNAIVTHILHAFVSIETIKEAFATPIAGFKDFCKIAMSILPKDYDQEKLDIFFQWQWQIKGENDKTYLELPKKMSYGRWICKAVEPVGGVWKTFKHSAPEASTPVALKYEDEAGNVHPFIRNGWFMLSNFATQQKAEASAATESFKEEGAGTETGTEEGAKW